MWVFYTNAGRCKFALHHNMGACSQANDRFLQVKKYSTTRILDKQQMPFRVIVGDYGVQFYWSSVIIRVQRGEAYEFRIFKNMRVVGTVRAAHHKEKQAQGCEPQGCPK